MAPGVRGLSDINNDLYFLVKAFHLKWQELPLDANVKKWSVHILSLDRQRRHLDRATLNMFWEVLDKYVLFIFIQRFSVVDKLYADGQSYSNIVCVHWFRSGSSSFIFPIIIHKSMHGLHGCFPTSIYKF